MPHSWEEDPIKFKKYKIIFRYDINAMTPVFVLQKRSQFKGPPA